MARSGKIRMRDAAVRGAEVPTQSLSFPDGLFQDGLQKWMKYGTALGRIRASSWISMKKYADQRKLVQCGEALPGGCEVIAVSWTPAENCLRKGAKRSRGWQGFQGRPSRRPGLLP